MDELKIYVGIGTAIASAIYYLFRMVKAGKNKEDRISGICWPLVDRFKCNRVFIIRFHNGKAYSGDHRQKMTIDYEFTGEKPMKSYFKAVPVSEEVHRVMLHLKKNKHYFFESWTHVADDEQRHAYRSWNINAMYLFPIYEKEKVKYTISLTWGTMKYLSEADLQFIYREVKLLGNELI